LSGPMMNYSPHRAPSAGVRPSGHLNSAGSISTPWPS
jgi:hypothetical protein